ncbi:MAG: glycosyltransferase family 2 protein [Candidatus Paceibacterota bacterium]
MKNTTISIIMPSFNQGHFVEETMKSIFSQEGDFFIDYIITDGGSKDNSVEIIKKYDDLLKKNLYPIKCKGIELRWWSKKDKGQTDAMNQGFKIAKGEIVAFMSSDDCYEQGTFQKVLNIFNSNPDVDLVYGGGYYLYEDTGVKTFFEVIPTNFNDLLLKGNNILVSSVFMKYSTLKKVNYMDESLNYAMDYDLWLKIFMTGKTVAIKDALSIYRFHSESKAVSQADKFAKELKKLRKRYGGYIIESATIGKIRSKIKLLEFLKKGYPKIYFFIKKIVYLIVHKFKYKKSLKNHQEISKF